MRTRWKARREADAPARQRSDYCYLHDPDPAVAARRRRNASRAATLSNSRIVGREHNMTVIGDEVRLTDKGLAEIG